MSPAPAQSRPRSVVCLSGGMDSCVTAAIAARASDAYALHFSYGQRTEARELNSARSVANELGLSDFLHLRMDLFRRIGGSALTDARIAVPDAAPDFGQPAESAHDVSGGKDESGEKVESKQESTIPVTYVPFRNAHFIAAAVSWAEVLGASRIYIGAVEQDSSGYPDCRPGYFEAFQHLIDVGTKAGAEESAQSGSEKGPHQGKIRIMTPLIALSKAQIVRLGLEYNAPLDLTWSCYRDEQQACGACESCVLRLRGFAAAKVRDPINYAADTHETTRSL